MQTLAPDLDTCQSAAGGSPPGCHDRQPKERICEQRTPTSHYGRAALAGELDKVERSSEGFRTRTLFAAAAALGELVEGGELDRTQAEAQLEAAGRLVGLADLDVARTVRRGLERGKRRPRRARGDGPCLVTVERAEVIAQLTAWWRRVSVADWPGMAGSTRLRINAGLFLLALGAGKVELNDSLRQVSEACGLSHVTVWRHRASLSPWVKVVSRGRRSGGRHRWRLCLAAGAPSCAQDETSRADPAGSASGLLLSARPPVPHSLTDPAHDLWGRWSGGWRLFCLLDEGEGATARQLAEVTGYAVGSVRRSLARLRDMGLAERDDDGEWRLVESAQPREEDVVDHAARRRSRHVRQRVNYRRYRAEREAARERARECRGTVSNMPTVDEGPPPVDPETGEVAVLSVSPTAPEAPVSAPLSASEALRGASIAGGADEGADGDLWAPGARGAA